MIPGASRAPAASQGGVLRCQTVNRYLIGFVAATLAVSATAAAQGAPAVESADDKRARGEQLAKDGRFSEAIDAFKAAEKLEPRARHACLIALAYMRRELWPQAEIFLEQCELRATPADPVPEWVPVAKAQLAERLQALTVAAVELVVEPAGTKVKLAVSSFAPDELFDPRTIHLPLGRHVIIATAAGYKDAQKTVEVTGPVPQRVTISMVPIDATKDTPGAPRGPAPAASKVPWIVMGAGGAVALAGAITHVTMLRTARNEMIAADKADNLDRYQTWEARFETRRTATIALYGVGAALAVTGLILDRTVFAHRESSVQVALVPQAGGGVITLGWSP